MDGKQKFEKKKNPREGANPLSALTFTWILRTFWLGYRRDLEVSDLYKPLKEHTSSVLGDKLATLWEAECQKINEQRNKALKSGAKFDNESNLKEPSLLKVLIKCFGARIMFYGIILVIMEIVLRPRKYTYTLVNGDPLYKKQNNSDMVLQPLCLGYLLRYYNTQEVSKNEAYLYALGVILCSAVNIFVVHPYMMAILHMGMKMRVACCSLIYRKALRLSRTALGKTTVGQAVNLLSNDVNRFDVAIIFLHYLWIAPLETMIITYFMFAEVQISAIIGVVTLLMFIPLQGYLGKKSSELRLRTAIRTDERVRLTNEIITGIQAIKMYTWEKPFSDLIEKARKKEINVIRSTSYIRGVTMSFIIFTTRMCLFITILAYVLFGGKITAEKVFILTAYYNILRQTMTVFFPQGITQVAEAMVSIKRLQKFMMYEEIMPEKNIDKNKNIAKKKHKKSANLNNEVNEDLTNKRNSYDEQPKLNSADPIKLENAFAKWFSSENEYTLQDINVHVRPGELIAIVGQVGSGKSSLLNVILKELKLSSGTLKVNGNTAYSSQEPWLFAGSVRQNILFGRPMDQVRYNNVVKVCQLKRDFSLLPYGDKTIVGERGISLSGGQRARINLARAVYAESEIYLFDDPLSAVDAHVGKHMFEECIVKYLKGKTRILVTHQLQYLHNVGRIIVLKDGSIQAEGTYDELGSKGVDFGRLLETQAVVEEHPPSASASRSNSRNPSISSLSSYKTNDTSKQPEPDEEAEMRTKGSVSGKVYAGYLLAGGNWFIVTLIFGFCAMAQLAASGGDFFISRWVNMEEISINVTSNGTEIFEWQGPIDRDTCIYIYSGLTVLTIGITLIRSASFFNMCMRASMTLHDKMFRCISNAKMRFFNTNNSGRVLNRFSKDMGAVDELLPIALIDCIQIGLSLLGIIVVVAIANPWLLIPTVVIGVVFYFLRVFYIATSRSVKRLEGITRSPVFGHLNATLQGLPTIRSFEAGDILIKEFDNHQDLHSSAWFIFIASSRAFGFWLDVFCLVYIALVTLSFLIMYDDASGSMEGGNVGLAITQSIGLTGMFQWGMRQSAELENQMTSVERILEYSKVENEPLLESPPDKKPPEDWPQQGKIEFKEVSMQYSVFEPPVLKDLSFEIKSREKIGIVGRTGAGKSSLISALFRFAEIEGPILVDGIDTREIGLHDLRSKMSIIPQEPFLFSGSLRRNLDPFDTYRDDILWQALEEVELKEMGLEAHINEGGSNLSVGQRQLVCLARAIVRNNPILILDEATANVDPRTDELIQKTIRQKFEKCTVLTIAHRLNTVMDNDRILVMDAGRAVEFDHPHILLQNSKGYLSSMVQETGQVMAEALTAIARDNYTSRYTSTTL
ncbi:PREDICTED: probable multidrug resistance-associated protein lethal(2)03659 isoform X2 [Polistes dominula]|uniref:Probable multidrug resistance-associated protein lethal(2)03659 isoform X2 n=1 Tax=Polistes dominula TaxID=743375 RepID=A0ABM1IW41_POLDO|nr:PREDICTED: probable multidrug resistance-associated protein lethal(2)03659 isoform X2 [Polistes dominula]